MTQLIDSVVSSKEAVSPSQYKRLVELEDIKDFNLKSGLDFSYALQHCYDASSSPYIAIFEGDILLANGWFARAILEMQDIVKRTSATGKLWLDMRLFNEIRGVGWASQDLFGNNVPITILAVSFAPLIILLAIWCHVGKSFLTNKTLFIVCRITIPVTIIIFFQAGKASVIPTLLGVSVQGWGCCTQGIIILRERVPGLVVELQRRASELPPNLVIRDHATS